MNESDCGLLEKWRNVTAATVSDCLGRWHAMDAAVERRCGERMVGHAFPVRVMPGDNLTIHEAISSVPAGSVLVIDAGGYANRAVWGELLSAAAMARGAVGVVVDGAVRDVSAQRELGFGCWSRAVSPAGPHKSGGGAWGEPISCGGTTVSPGDLVIADEDGVVVVPAAKSDETYHAPVDRMEAETDWKAQLLAGRTSASLLGISK
ncbi:RraA family protein [Rhodococcus pseudokoreensis]|uniref:Putative 4-hydroxy-4-methyl-2-oxoglutarate aldolase n=1 Tax=Rhodococcus pseudokoreensis TaxID=2811421 RepID=A0A974WBI8_9NOCA|nr:RraA family protein [Rhodococcus pseudokoreensis]QSE93753.1 RraA family protein [Rhodococcus pseudokoreensis]